MFKRVLFHNLKKQAALLPKKQNALVTTQKRYWQQSLPNKKSKGFAKQFREDSGNIPILVANLTAVGLILLFAGRKIFYHPDVLLSRDTRKIITNYETIERDDLAYGYKEQTKHFAEMLAPVAKPIVELVNGQNGYSPKIWALEYTRNNDQIETPMEFTEAFHDGLFPGIKGNSSAKRDNGNVV